MREKDPSDAPIISTYIYTIYAYMCMRVCSVYVVYMGLSSLAAAWVLIDKKIKKQYNCRLNNSERVIIGLFPWNFQ